MDDIEFPQIKDRTTDVVVKACEYVLDSIHSSCGDVHVILEYIAVMVTIHSLLFVLSYIRWCFEKRGVIAHVLRRFWTRNATAVTDRTSQGVIPKSMIRSISPVGADNNSRMKSKTNGDSKVPVALSGNVCAIQNSPLMRHVILPSEDEPDKQGNPNGTDIDENSNHYSESKRPLRVYFERGAF